MKEVFVSTDWPNVKSSLNCVPPQEIGQSYVAARNGVLPER
jgi:hypothetical protein